MPKRTTHPLYEVSARAPRLQLISTEQGVVRLRDEETQLWILVASENGSIMDRWAADEEAPFLLLDEATVAGGADAILAEINKARAEMRDQSTGGDT